MTSLSKRKKQPKIKGTPADRSFVRPVCSKGHDPSKMVHEPEGWVCLTCADEFLADQPGIRETSRGGVILPTGVRNPNAPKFSEVMPSRRVRRRYK